MVESRVMAVSIEHQNNDHPNEHHDIGPSLLMTKCVLTLTGISCANGGSRTIDQLATRYNLTQIKEDFSRLLVWYIIPPTTNF